MCFLFSQENRIWHFMQIVSSFGDNLHEMLKPVFYENKTNILKCRLLMFLPSMLNAKLKPDLLSIPDDF